MQQSPQPVVSVDRLRHSFGAITALDGISFEVSKGEIFGLIGPDGAGKTTTMRILAGLIDPVDGTAKIMGHDPRDTSASVREAVGYMPQQYSLYGDLSIGENLKFFGDLFCLDKQTFQTRTKRLLEITRLTPFVDRRAEALSGGMYKKMALSAALLHEPVVLLLDEPTNGVDPVSRGELWDLLYQFAHEGMAIVVSTSYMDEAARCSRVGLVHHGRIILEGQPGKLVAGFDDDVFVVRPGQGGQVSRFETIAETYPLIGLTPAGDGLRIAISRNHADELRRELVKAGASIVPAQPSFEDIFLRSVASREDAS